MKLVIGVVLLLETAERQHKYIREGLFVKIVFLIRVLSDGPVFFPA